MARLITTELENLYWTAYAILTAPKRKVPEVAVVCRKLRYFAGFSRNPKCRDVEGVAICNEAGDLIACLNVDGEGRACVAVPVTWPSSHVRAGLFDNRELKAFYDSLTDPSLSAAEIAAIMEIRKAMETLQSSISSGRHRAETSKAT